MIKNRVKGLIHLRPEEIEKNPKNWRRHPEEQRGALRAVLEKVGIASACLVYKNKAGKYQLIDGELRTTEISEQPIPCLELDVSDGEADILLASIDSISSLADTDDVALQQLLDEMDQKGLDDLLKQIEPDATTDDLGQLEDEDEGEAKYEIAPVFDEGYHCVAIFARTELEWSKIQQALGLKKKREKNPKDKPNSPIGTCRVMTYQEFDKQWTSR